MTSTDINSQHGSDKGTEMTDKLEMRKAVFTYDNTDGMALYYFAPQTRTPGKLTQRRVEAIIDICEDGTLAGVELIDNMPPLDADSPHTLTNEDRG